eukprot:INCI231.1.p1 GENE.INCI231.1~~INCI231.1.p1  ORF type:complete len:186 (+),score=39.02 INCI231.1:116-673(+)
MGAYYSEPGELSPDELNFLSDKVNFNANEIQTLFSRFKKLDREQKGVINRGCLLKIPELAMNPLVDRIIQCFETDDEGNITFTSFLTCLSQLSRRGSLKDKLDVAFRVYDIDGDGFVSVDELAAIFRLMVGENMTEQQILKVALDTVASAAQDGERISRADFFKLFCNRESELKRIFSVKVVTRD